MQITILAIGSRGDIQPYVALGLGLQAAGHKVRVASHAIYGSFVTQRGLAFHPMAGNPLEIIQTEQARRWMESGRNFISFMRQLIRLTADVLDDLLQDCWQACQGAEAIVFSSLGIPGYHIAERLQIPSFSAPLQPLSRTRAFPSMYLPTHLPLGGTINLLSHWLTEQIFWQPMRRQINRWRVETLNLPPLPFLGPFRCLLEEKLPFLYGFSEHVIPRPQDWPPFHHITGYWFLEPDRPWDPPPALCAFLDAGPPPVYVGFGSMVGRDPGQLTRLVVEALHMSGQRGILMSGWGGIQAEDLPPDVFLLETAPHHWLFPRMRLLVHHGGAGTTAAGLCAGVPTIVAPFFGDQPFWGQRIQALGVGPAPIPLKRLTAARLAEAIQTTLADDTVRERAATLGARLRSEDGVANAVSLFQQYAGNA